MPSPQPLIREAADGDARNVLLLLEAGADLEAAQENKIGFTALNQAVSRLRVRPSKMERGAWAGQRGGGVLLADKWCGQAYFGHPQVIKHLIDFRADVDTIDAYGGTPLVAASLNGALDCVRVLTRAGADANHTTINGNTPLMKAAINGCAALS